MLESIGIHEFESKPVNMIIYIYNQLLIPLVTLIWLTRFKGPISFNKPSTEVAFLLLAQRAAPGSILCVSEYLFACFYDGAD